MIGFDNIELSMQLLSNRKDAVRELNAFLSGGSSQAQPPAREQPNGRSKGKQKQGTLYSLFMPMSNEALIHRSASSSQLDSLDPAEARKRMEETLRANADRPLYTGTAVY